MSNNDRRLREATATTEGMRAVRTYIGEGEGEEEELIRDYNHASVCKLTWQSPNAVACHRLGA
jgi:hypothetical protein